MFSQVFVCPRGWCLDLCAGGLDPEGSLSRGVSVWGVPVQGGSVQGDLCQGDPTDRDASIWQRAGGMHPTGMHSCLPL